MINDSSSYLILENMRILQDKIELLARYSNRILDDITIVAVTKTIDVKRIKILYNAGFRNFGENKVQELCNKYDRLGRNCIWHFIGHLQTNKVKYIIDKVKIIHSLDRIELALEIQKRIQKINKIMEVLIQVNISKEPTKFGISQESVLDFIKNISNFPNIKVKGLMTIAPFTSDKKRVS